MHKSFRWGPLLCTTLLSLCLAGPSIAWTPSSETSSDHLTPMAGNGYRNGLYSPRESPNDLFFKPINACFNKKKKGVGRFPTTYYDTTCLKKLFQTFIKWGDHHYRTSSNRAERKKRHNLTLVVDKKRYNARHRGQLGKFLSLVKKWSRGDVYYTKHRLMCTADPRNQGWTMVRKCILAAAPTPDQCTSDVGITTVHFGVHGEPTLIEFTLNVGDEDLCSH